MFRHCIFILFILCVLVPASFTFSATTSFPIQTLIGFDNPPTTPTGLTATPVASTQIDLSWNPSTDDFGVIGYHVWRDSVQIATTALTSYMDVGLTASTTYTYFVDAFDASANISTSSSLVATTTLPAPVVPLATTTATSSNSSGTKLKPFNEMILSLEILPQKDSVVIRYTTNSHIRSIIKWGRTSSYELGSLAEQAFSVTHETHITGLTPGTVYQFTIEGQDQFSRSGIVHVGHFTTLPPEDTFPPGNVTGLTGVRAGDDIALSWKLPEDPDFDHVRIVRSDVFYPSDIADGWVVYEGRARDFRDTSVEKDVHYYYTVFSYDALGNISSGAVVLVRSRSENAIPLEEIDPTLNEIALSFDDIIFTQEGVRLPMLDGLVDVDGSKQLTIAIPYDKVPEHLKTILVIIGEPKDPEKTFQFLLRVNTDRTFYTSTLAPFGTWGEYPISIAVFDFTTAQIGYVHGILSTEIATNPFIPPVTRESFLSYVLSFLTSYFFWFICVLLILLFVGMKLVRSR